MPGPESLFASGIDAERKCFDISLWQLVSALLVGGRTLLVEQETILDVQRFVDKIADGRVAVLQVVPSYLEVVLSYLEQHPRELPALRCVSVTADALQDELEARRGHGCVRGPRGHPGKAQWVPERARREGERPGARARGRRRRGGGRGGGRPEQVPGGLLPRSGACRGRRPPSRAG